MQRGFGSPLGALGKLFIVKSQAWDDGLQRRGEVALLNLGYLIPKTNVAPAFGDVHVDVAMLVP